MKKKIIARVFFSIMIVVAVAAVALFSSDKAQAASSLSLETESFSFLSLESILSAKTGTIDYVGCFKDTSDFDLNGYLERSRNNTPQRCIGICQAKGFKYAGVQYGESCLCGNSYGKYGTASNCNYKCTGNAGQVCGGYNANSIYTTGAGGETTTTTGCQAANNYNIRITPNPARPGERLKVYFSYPNGKPASGDWLGYFPVGSNQYIEWYWVKDLANCESNFTANKAGNYEFRYLLEGGYEKVAARVNFTITN